MLQIQDKTLLQILKAALEYAYQRVGPNATQFWDDWARLKGVDTVVPREESTGLIDLRIAVENALEASASETPVHGQSQERGIADINKFLDKVRLHCNATGGDKYAKDRAIEPADAIVDWFGEGWLLGTAVKYLARLMKTKKLTDAAKAVHYIGMYSNFLEKTGAADERKSTGRSNG